MQNNRYLNIVKLVDKKYLDQIINLHIQAFKGVLSGQTGKLFLKFYYKSILKEGIIFAGIEEDTVVGFVSGIRDERKISGIVYYFYAIIGIITHFYLPELYLNILRHIKRIKNFSDVTTHPELLSIVIKEEMRGKGFGTMLVNSLEKEFIKYNINHYKVYTDMMYSTGYRLYEKLGFELFREVDLYGLPFRMYCKKIQL